jgi:hypothetical protein
MRVWENFPHHPRRLASVDEIIDDQHALAAAAADFHDAAGHVFEHLELALRDMVVARDAHRLDQPDAELARHDRRRHQAAARHADDGLERPGAGEPPGQRAGIAVELVPSDRKGFLWLRLRLRKRLRHELPSPAGTVRALGSACRRKREDSIGQSGLRFQVAGAGANSGSRWNTGCRRPGCDTFSVRSWDST